MAQQLKRIVEESFERGYNDENKPENLRTKNGVFMADILNAFIDDNKLKQRKGFVAIGDASKVKPVLGQARHEPHGGSKYILRAINNAGDTQSVIEGWSGTGNWAELTSATTQTASSRHEFVTVNDSTYIFNESTDTVLKTANGTSASTVAAIPKGFQGRWFHNFFFVIGVIGQESRLYFSDVNTPETFDAMNGFIDVNPGDNEPIAGLAVLKDELLIFKASRVWSLTGFGTSDFTLTDLGERVTGVGTESRRSILETGNDVYYLSNQGRTPHFRSIRRTAEGTMVDGGIISNAISTSMERIVTSNIDEACAVFDGRSIWFSVATGSDTTNKELFVMDTVTGGWTRHTGINANVMHISTISGVPLIYFGDSTATGLSYVLNNVATNDNGVAIDCQVLTPYYNPQPGFKAKYKYIYITADVDDDLDLDLDFSRDGFTLDDLATVPLDNPGAIFDNIIVGTSRFGSSAVVKKRVNGAGGNAYFMQYRFRNNTLDKELVLRGWEIFYKMRGLRAA